MRLHIIAFGKQKNHPSYELTQTYFNRLPFSGSIVELEGSLSSNSRGILEEGEKVFKFLSLQAVKGYRLIVMDKSGIDTSSEQLAEIIKTWRNKAIPACYFAVGGANGHSEKLISSAHYCIRFGSATWPHLLFRAMLAEQLYRAEMILKNHPYHNSH